MTGVVIASIDRAGDHAVVVGALALVAVVAGLVYWLVQLVGRRRADRTSSRNSPHSTRRPEA